MRKLTNEWSSSINLKKKHFLKAKRRKIKKTRILFEERIKEELDDIDNDDHYYKVLFGDIDNESTISLYATTPENQNELQPDDELAGEQSILNYQCKFKKYKKIKEKEKLEDKTPVYPLVEFLDATDTRRVLPKTLGLIKKKPLQVGTYPSNKVSTIFVGKDYTVPLSEGLKVIKKLKELDLSSSDLDYDKLVPILKNIPISLESLKIPQNFNLTPGIYQLLGSLIEDKTRK